MTPAARGKSKFHRDVIVRNDLRRQRIQELRSGITFLSRVRKAWRVLWGRG